MKPKKTKKPLNVLVVEDNEKYRDEAKKLLTNYQRKTKRKLNLLFGKDYDEGRQILENERIDFGLYDIFLPSKDKKLMKNLVDLLTREYSRGKEGDPRVDWERVSKEYIDALNKILKNDQAPLGIILSHLSNIYNVLNVNVTDKGHHSVSLNPVCMEERWTIRLPMIESADKGYNKGWKRAMAYLASFKFGDETCVPISSWSKKPTLTLKYFHDEFKDKNELLKRQDGFVKYHSPGRYGTSESFWGNTRSELLYKLDGSRENPTPLNKILESDFEKTYMRYSPSKYRLLNFTEDVKPETLKALNKIDKIILDKIGVIY